MNAALLGPVRDEERRPGYFDGLLSAAKRVLSPEYRRERAARLREAARRLKASEYTGRPRNPVVTPAAWVTDMAELGQSILLCHECDPKFEPSHKRYHYHRDTRWKTQCGGSFGVCDGCRANMAGPMQLYIHQSYVGKGIGQSYVP